MPDATVVFVPFIVVILAVGQAMLSGVDVARAVAFTPGPVVLMLVGALIHAGLTGLVARAKGYNDWWIVLGFLLGIPALLAAAGLPQKTPPRP